MKCFNREFPTSSFLVQAICQEENILFINDIFIREYTYICNDSVFEPNYMRQSCQKASHSPKVTAPTFILKNMHSTGTGLYRITPPPPPPLNLERNLQFSRQR